LLEEGFAAEVVQYAPATVEGILAVAWMARSAKFYRICPTNPVIVAASGKKRSSGTLGLWPTSSEKQSVSSFA